MCTAAAHGWTGQGTYTEAYAWRMASELLRTQRALGTACSAPATQLWLFMQASALQVAYQSQNSTVVLSASAAHTLKTWDLRTSKVRSRASSLSMAAPVSADCVSTLGPYNTATTATLAHHIPVSCHLWCQQSCPAFARNCLQWELLC